MSLLSPLGQNVSPPIWKNLKSRHPMIFSTKFGWNWPSGLPREEKIESRQCIIITTLLFLHGKKAWPLIYINLNFLNPKNILCNVWLKFWQWFWRCRFLKVVKVFSLYRYYLPIEKGRGLSSIRTFKNPYSKAILSQVCKKLIKWFWRKLQ